MALLRERLPALQRELGVTQLVSRWDDDAMKGVREPDCISITDRLVREFLLTPTEKQRWTIESLKSAKPLPLWRAKLLNLAGGL